MHDPLVAALTAAVEEALARGVHVTPSGDGWLVKLTPADAKDAPAYDGTGTSPDAQVRRTW